MIIFLKFSLYSRLVSIRLNLGRLSELQGRFARFSLACPWIPIGVGLLNFSCSYFFSSFFLKLAFSLLDLVDEQIVVDHLDRI